MLTSCTVLDGRAVRYVEIRGSPVYLQSRGCHRGSPAAYVALYVTPAHAIQISAPASIALLGARISCRQCGLCCAVIVRAAVITASPHVASGRCKGSRWTRAGLAGAMAAAWCISASHAEGCHKLSVLSLNCGGPQPPGEESRPTRMPRARAAATLKIPRVLEQISAARRDARVRHSR